MTTRTGSRHYVRCVERLVVWVRRHRWTVDLPLYAVFLFLGPNWNDAGSWGVRAIPMLFLLPLLVRRRFPRTVAVLIIAGAASVYLNEIWAYDRGRTELAMAVVLFNLVKARHRWFAALIGVAVVTLDVQWASLWGNYADDQTFMIIATLPLHVAAWVLGEFFRKREQLAAEERKLVDAQGRAAAAEERTRIARELHDV